MNYYSHRHLQSLATRSNSSLLDYYYSHRHLKFQKVKALLLADRWILNINLSWELGFGTRTSAVTCECEMTGCWLKIFFLPPKFMNEILNKQNKNEILNLWIMTHRFIDLKQEIISKIKFKTDFEHVTNRFETWSRK